MFYVIEKRDAEWIVLANGVAIMRCAEAQTALEIVQAAQEQLSAAESDEAAPAIAAPSLAPQQAESQPLEYPEEPHQITLRPNKFAKSP